MSEPKSLWTQHIEDACPEGPFPPEESTRHPKWKAVPPGTVIPAGQPHCRRWSDDSGHYDSRATLTDDYAVPRAGNLHESWFVDSSWKPPLVLPTEPTWGIAVRRVNDILGKWQREDDQFVGYGNRSHYGGHVDDVLDFIPLTDEQVQRIEAAR